MKRSILLFALLLTGCGDIDFAIGPGMADFSAPLCGDYHLIRSSAHQIVTVHGVFLLTDPPAACVTV